MNAYKFNGLTGGTSSDLDSVSVDDLTTNDWALTDDTGVLYVHEYDSAGVAAESSPDVIRPDDYAASGNWLLSEGPADQPNYYGGISVTGGAAGLSVSTTPTKITNFATNDTADGVTVDHTGDDIEILTAADYALSFWLTGSIDESRRVYFSIYKNSLPLSHRTGFYLRTASEYIHVNIDYIARLAAGDLITAYFWSNVSSGTLTIDEAFLGVRSLGA